MVSSLLKRILKKSGYTLKKTDFFEKHYHSINDPHFRSSGDFNPLDQLFYKCLADDFFFMQIGANDGKRYDPIHHLIVREKMSVKGIAIEPIQEYFDELEITYKDFPRIKLIRKAIHNSQNEATIYKINPALSEIGEKFKGMSSFDIYNFTKDGISENDIIAEKVPCISFMDLIGEEKITKIHLLQIDAEGYDIEILKSIDFDKIKPLIINFEHRWQYNLILETEFFKILRTLINKGYNIVLNGNDAIAYIQ